MCFIRHTISTSHMLIMRCQACLTLIVNNTHVVPKSLSQYTSLLPPTSMKLEVGLASGTPGLIVGEDPLDNQQATFYRVWTACSASPLEAGWYEAVRQCWIPFLSTNVWNSVLVNGVPLFVTIVSGIPCLVNISLSLSLVFLLVAEDTTATSNHFEKESATTRNMCLWNELA